MKQFTLSLFSLLLFSGALTAQTTIRNDFFELNITSYGTTDSARISDIDRVAKKSLDYWATILEPYNATFDKTDKISVSLVFSTLESGTHGKATSSFVASGIKYAGDAFATPTTYEAQNSLTYNAINGAQAALMGVDRDSTLTDIEIEMNRGTNFYFGSDADLIGDSQIDFHSVLLHELTHGMGFQSALFGAPADSKSDQYTLNTVQFDGESASYNMISAFDTLILQNLLDNDPTELTLGAEVALGDTGYHIYNPATYAPGSSVSHIVASPDSEDFLMQYSIGDGVIRRELTATEIGIFSAMGMNVIPEPSSVFLLLTIGPAYLLRRRRQQAA